MKVLLSLARKEWHEHKWKTVALAAMLSVFVLGQATEDLAANLGMGSMLIGTMGALFIAIGVVAGERADGSIDFVRSLPVARWKVAVVRLTMSAALCAAPIVITALVAFGMQTAGVTRGSSAPIWEVTLIEVLGCLSLFFWITAITIDQPTQLRAGVIGVVVLLSWFAIGILLDNYSIQRRWPSGLLEAVLNLGPAGCWRLNKIPFTGPENWLSLLGFQFLSISILFVVSTMNYGRPPMPARTLLRGGNNVMELGHPFRSQRSALAWLQITEAVPICVSGTILLIAWSCALALFVAKGGVLVNRALDMLVNSAIVIGFLWVGVVGVSTFVPNLQPGLATFWRSRPIHAGRWFWSKFWLGAFISLVAIHVPALMAIDVSRKLAWLDRTGALIGYLCIPLAHLMVYSLAVLMACLFRHVVYAGILGLSAAALIVLLPVIGQPLGAGNDLDASGALDWMRFDVARRQLTAFVESGFAASGLDDLSFMPFVSLTFVLTVVAATAAAWAVKRDVAIYR